MALAAGTRLGPYEILAPIGAGGMGEVYKALDTKLDREVAVKVLPPAFSSDPERLARFEREAKVLASLNHPGIAAIYGVEDRALVMEMVPGPTLADRIAQGPIAPAEAEEILLQIADALEYAHERGVMHRDLKPANIKIDPEDKVKILDFGLAKAFADPMASGVSDPTNSPTITMGATVAGTILGTAAYMAPEQARGKKVDRRADIWAFGVVVYEMLTGQRLFQGEDTVQVLSRVLEHKPDLDRVPVKFRKLLTRCLDRNPKDRLRDIGEVRFLLQENAVALEGGADLGRGAGPHPGTRTRLWPVAAATLALVTAALAYVAYRHSAEDPPRAERFSLLTPEGTNFGAGAIPQISPDGRRIVFAAQIEGQQSLWLRDIDSLRPRMLPGTTGASFPFWSPDSRWVAFFAEGKLKKIDVTGGPAIALCDVAAARGSRPIVRGGAWNRDDVIVFGLQNSGLVRVPAAGGTPVAFTEPDRAAGETAGHYYPWFLPDGRHFLYTARSQDAHKTRIYVESIDARPGSKTRKEVLAADTNVVYVPVQAGIGLSLPGFHEKGYLLFVRERTLMAQAFDPSKLQTTGDAVPIAESVDRVDGISFSYFSASRNGTLVYNSGGLSGNKTQLTWLDRNGKSTGMVGAPADIQWASISPDGSTIAADPSDASGVRDIWLYNLARGTNPRFTFGPGVNQFPLWSPDGSRIAFSSQRDGSGNPYVKPANGIGGEEALDKNPRNNRIEDWSRDGRYLIEGVVDLKTSSDIWVIPQFGDKKPFPYINTEFRELEAKLSPNSQWLAYMSDESKREEVYVQTFPEHGGKWQISTAGGNFPVWSRDGREMYFISADRKMMAVPVGGSGKGFAPGVPKALFDVAAQGKFDVNKDGRFLMQVPIEQAAAKALITVVTNWQTSLKK